ncbi:Integrase core domain-containing protein [Sphingomonas gellani]|uniref:Integrase core domain-containing protein n=1 Tax=Sphingomonas gellani TaxID=1166340 RepID=A0A1H8DZD8_9SPHN|nr:Integrase core domain-containing protein [Sphingomonas gellani]
MPFRLAAKSSVEKHVERELVLCRVIQGCSVDPPRLLGIVTHEFQQSWEYPEVAHGIPVSGITAEDVQDLMVATVEHRYGRVNRVPQPIEWLTDNGSCYTARDTRTFARGIGLLPLTTPLSSPQSNGVAEAFVRTLKRDYVRVSPRPDAHTVIAQLPDWIDHYNEVHPHRALGYSSPREFIAATREALSAN